MIKLIFAALMVLASGALVFAGVAPATEPDPPATGGTTAEPDDDPGSTHGSGNTGDVEDGAPTQPSGPPPDRVLLQADNDGLSPAAGRVYAYACVGESDGNNGGGTAGGPYGSGDSGEPPPSTPLDNDVK